MAGRLTGPHPEDFALLRYVGGEVDDLESARIRRHLNECALCNRSLRALIRVDRHFRQWSDILTKQREATDGGMAPGDPFLERPAAAARSLRELGLSLEAFLATALPAAEAAEEPSLGLASRVLESPEEARRALDALDLSGLSNRFLLARTLQRGSVLISEGPARWRDLADAAVSRVKREPFVDVSAAPKGAVSLTEFACPIADLLGNAYVLAGHARNCTGELDRGGVDLVKAYGFFARGRADESDFAMVELHESQRRSFDGRPRQGLALAERAERTFERTLMPDFAARARYARALALAVLKRPEEALALFRDARTVFEEHALWAMYDSTLGSIGAALAELGRLDEARREYARALRLGLKRRRGPMLAAGVRLGLAHLMRDARRFEEAARHFAKAAAGFDDLDMPLDALSCKLDQIQCLARAQQAGRAQALLADLEEGFVARGLLDPAIVRAYEEALEGLQPDLVLLGQVQERALREVRIRVISKK